MSALLEVRNVTLKFGGVTAVNDVSFDVEEGEVFALVGPNGAGKSTLFNLISRFYDPYAGDIRFAGESILKKLQAHEIAGSASPAPSRTSSCSTRRRCCKTSWSAAYAHRRATCGTNCCSRRSCGRKSAATARRWRR
jgi:ABC-type Mn2+/Zn2+ transport system ATPase subunit